MSISRLTKKYQATLPSDVRKALRLRAGDRVIFEIENNKVILHKAKPLDIEFARSLNSTLNEWGSEFDEEAYRDL